MSHLLKNISLPLLILSILFIHVNKNMCVMRLIDAIYKSA